MAEKLKTIVDRLLTGLLGDAEHAEQGHHAARGGAGVDLAGEGGPFRGGDDFGQKVEIGAAEHHHEHHEQEDAEPQPPELGRGAGRFGQGLLGGVAHGPALGPGKGNLKRGIAWAIAFGDGMPGGPKCRIAGGAVLRFGDREIGEDALPALCHEAMALARTRGAAVQMAGNALFPGAGACAVPLICRMYHRLVLVGEAVA